MPALNNIQNPDAGRRFSEYRSHYGGSKRNFKVKFLNSELFSVLFRIYDNTHYLNSY